MKTQQKPGWNSCRGYSDPKRIYQDHHKAQEDAAAAAKSIQSCLTLCDHIDGSPPGSPVPGILQTRTLEWVAISFSNAWKWKVKVKSLSHVQLLVTPWTAAHQAPPSMGFSRQEYWSGVPLPSSQEDEWMVNKWCWNYSLQLEKNLYPQYAIKQNSRWSKYFKHEQWKIFKN